MKLIVSFSPELIGQLNEHKAGHLVAGQEALLPTWWLGTPERGGRFSLRFKTIGFNRLEEGMVYQVHCNFKPAATFTSGDGLRCSSRDITELRCCHSSEESQGVMQFLRYPKGTQPSFPPGSNILWQKRIPGEVEHGVLFVSPKIVVGEAELCVDEVVFSGNCFVDLPAYNREKDRQLPGSFARSFLGDVTVYDRRKIPGILGFAAVEKIRRTLASGKEFEFINVRNIGHRIDPGTVQWKLDGTGLNPWDYSEYTSSKEMSA